MDENNKISLNPATLLSPVPVTLISCRGMGAGEDKPNLITLAWAGTVCSDPPMVSISIRKSRFSHHLIRESGEFVVNLVDEDLIHAADYCGVKSGRDVDKFAKCRLTAVAAPGLAYAPALAESPLSMSCQVRQILELGSHDCFIGEIIAVTANASLMNKDQSLRLDLAKLVAYCHGDYFALGQILGFHGYSVASPEVLARRLPRPSGLPGKSPAKPRRKSRPEN